MKPAPFDYHAPATRPRPCSLLAELGDAQGARRRAEPGADAGAAARRLRPPRRPRAASTSCAASSGATARSRSARRPPRPTIERSAEVAGAVPLLARATPLIGHFQIRNRGTIGGSLAHADPAAEYPAVALALDAELETLSPRGRRVVPAADFFTGLWTTALDDDEMLTGVAFPVWPGRCGFAIEEFARRHGDFAIAGAAVAVELDDDDGQPLRASACSGSARRRCGPPRPRRRCSARALDESTPTRSAGSAMAELDVGPVRPPRLGRLPPAASARRWSRGPGERRSRRHAMAEIADRGDASTATAPPRPSCRRG